MEHLIFQIIEFIDRLLRRKMLKQQCLLGVLTPDKDDFLEPDLKPPREAKFQTITKLIRRKQFASLRQILRRPETDPDRLICFEPGTILEPRRPPRCRVIPC